MHNQIIRIEIKRTHDCQLIECKEWSNLEQNSAESTSQTVHVSVVCIIYNYIFGGGGHGLNQFKF